MEKKLHRIPDQAVFGGVASGIAQYLQIDVVIVRVLFVVMLFLPIPPSFGWTGILYIILWAVLPTGAADVHNFDTITSKPHDPEAEKKRNDQTIKILGGALVLFGIFMLIDDFPLWYQIKPYFWPIALITIGAFLILRQRDKEQEGNTTVYPTTPPPTEPVEPYTPTPDPQPYTPFGTNESTLAGSFPEDPNGKKADDDDEIIKVN
ncbi:phage shock protein C (PspC) family protein [Dyadobacter koreensis]|uniref:Phage shock protein C (PspC) family protein n=1 Tax=Dyadobacter koreensis TaxID=408657 RepID=A0A1H6RDJ7_9BACT|nr:PspC domain-containing protein [Dyadobacter koreensis]SEI53803.1 phage shock protein C (PspC) family protein [Dyadobacter koreensis]